MELFLGEKFDLLNARGVKLNNEYLSQLLVSRVIPLVKPWAYPPSQVHYPYNLTFEDYLLNLKKIYGLS